MTEARTTDPFRPPEPPSASAMRLLPWMTPEGKPTYLIGRGGFLSRLADTIEEQQLDSAKQVLDIVPAILDNPDSGVYELRFAARRLYESLTDTLRVAVRTRLQGSSTADLLTPTVVSRWPHNPESVGQARRELRTVLARWRLDELADAAQLVLSELLTNAVRHASSPEGREIETRYERMDLGVRIEVHDANDTWPEIQAPSTDAEFGRGLNLVDALTRARWGVSERHGVGKLIWAVVSEGAAEEVNR